MNKILVMITGLVTSIFGISIIINPRFYDTIYGRYWDFTSIKLPFGVFLIILGLYFTWYSLRKS